MNQTILETLRRYINTHAPHGSWLQETPHGLEIGVPIDATRTLTLPLPHLTSRDLPWLEHALNSFFAEAHKTLLRASFGLDMFHTLEAIEDDLEDLPVFQEEEILPEPQTSYPVDPDIYQRSTSLLNTNEIVRRLQSQRVTMASPTIQLHTSHEERLAELNPHLARRGGRAYLEGDIIVMEVPAQFGSVHRTTYSITEFMRLPVPELLARALEETGAIPKHR